MDVEFKKIHVLNTMALYSKNKNIISTLKKTLKNMLKDISNLLYDLYIVDFDELSNEEFYHLIVKSYQISLTSSDILETLKHIYQKPYTLKNVTITMVYKKDMNIFQRGYHAAVALNKIKKLEIPLNGSTLKKWVNSKDIILLEALEQELDLKNSYEFSFEKREDFTTMPLAFIEQSLQSINGNNFQFFISLLRKNISKQKVLEDIKMFLIELNNELECFFYANSFLSAMETQVLEEWYNSSLEKQKLVRLCKDFKSLEN